MGNSINDNLTNISGLINALEEVESYIVTDLKGKIHLASTENYNENTVNASIYLWVVGSRLGGEFKMGEPSSLIYYLKTRKILIQKYKDYIIILNLNAAIKFPDFKKKLYELLNREI